MPILDAAYNIRQFYTDLGLYQQCYISEETGLKLALLETPKTSFVASRPIYNPTKHYQNISKVIKLWSTKGFPFAETQTDSKGERPFLHIITHHLDLIIMQSKYHQYFPKV